jgi:hypothetical protein
VAQFGFWQKSESHMPPQFLYAERKQLQKIEQRATNLRTPKARCCGAMPTPPNESAGLEERRNLGSEAALSERSEFSRFPKF